MQEDKEAMIAGVRAVNTSRADLGIVVDTDVDRSAVVAGNGTPINSNRYIALMSYIALRPAPAARLQHSRAVTELAASIAKLPTGERKIYRWTFLPGHLDML